MKAKNGREREKQWAKVDLPLKGTFLFFLIENSFSSLASLHLPPVPLPTLNEHCLWPFFCHKNTHKKKIGL